MATFKAKYDQETEDMAQKAADHMRLRRAKTFKKKEEEQKKIFLSQKMGRDNFLKEEIMKKKVYFIK